MDSKMISMTPAELSPQEVYRLLLSTVVQRPIGWASTLGSDGTPNLAPFSFFNAVAGFPPTVMISVGRRAGNPKDTLRNAAETREMVVHIVTPDTVEAMNISSGEFPYEVNE
ncbi:MAG: flavin reductase family protein, partial [bacterium]